MKKLLFALCLILPVPLWATGWVAVANEGLGSNAATTTLTCTLKGSGGGGSNTAPTTGNFVVVAFTYGNTRTVTSVQDNASPTPTSYTVDTSNEPDCNANRSICVRMAYLASAPATATAVINITLSGNSTGAAWCKEFSGQAVSPFDTNGAAASVSASTTPSLPCVTPANANDLFVAVMSGGGTIGQQGGAGFTAIVAFNTTASAMWKIQSGGPSQQCALWTQSSNVQFASAEAAFSPLVTGTVAGIDAKKKKLGLIR